MSRDALIDALTGYVTTDTNGTVRYYNSTGELHRIDGPAVIYPGGAFAWFHNGRRHHIGGPAIIFANGEEHWYQNDVLHRTDGPAVRCADGSSVWVLNGKVVTEEEFNAYIESGNYDEPGSLD